MKLEAEDLWPIVLDFISTFFGEEDLQHFKKYFKLKINHQVSGPSFRMGSPSFEKLQSLFSMKLKCLLYFRTTP